MHIAVATEGQQPVTQCHRAQLDRTPHSDPPDLGSIEAERPDDSVGPTQEDLPSDDGDWSGDRPIQGYELLQVRGGARRDPINGAASTGQVERVAQASRSTQHRRINPEGPIAVKVSGADGNHQGVSCPRDQGPALSQPARHDRSRRPGPVRHPSIARAQPEEGIGGGHQHCP